MKLTVCFLLACSFIISQQHPQYMRQPRLPGYYYWPTPFYPSWNYNYQNPLLNDHHNKIFEDQVIPSPVVAENNEAKEQGIESRVKGGANVEKASDKSFNKPETRFLNSFGFVSNPYNYNPFLKTLYQFTSATATLCSVTTCIPAAQFADAAAQALICAGRKRRDDRAILEAIDTAHREKIKPSPVERLIPTALAEFGLKMKSKAFVYSDNSNLADIESSKEEDVGAPLRVKRNLFFFTSTITTYSFTTTTITSKLSLGADGALTCRPMNVGIC